MKNLLKISLLFFALAMISTSCKKKVDGTAAKVGEATGKAAATTAAAATYKVNVGKSDVRWTGSKSLGSDKHAGKLSISTGDMKVDGGKLVGGSFTIDMTSLKSDENLPKLEGHLKSADFFDVAKHPKATFVISKVAEAASGNGMTHAITGDLTIRGIAKSITFPASVQMAGDVVVATSDNFVINRTDWDVKYGSGLVGAAKDQMINDDVAVTVSINASK